jgi:hypothetical protein
MYNCWANIPPSGIRKPTLAHFGHCDQWPHGSVYFIGLAFGYILQKTRSKSIKNVKII